MTSKNRLADYLNKKSLEERQYFLDVMPAHLARQDMKKEFCKLLSDYDFMYSKISNFGTARLIDDYKFLDLIELDSEEKYSLRLIQSALRLSEPFLAIDNNQLTSQLWGRLPQEYPMIKKLLLQAKENCPRPFLHLYTPSLTQAGGPLINQFIASSLTHIETTHNGIEIISCSKNDTIKVFNVEGRETNEIIGNNGNPYYMIMTPNRKNIITSTHYEKSINVWDIESGRELYAIKGQYGSLAVTPDSKKLISGSRDKTVRIWDIENGKELRRLKRHTREISALAVTPDGKKILSGDEEGIIKIWDIESGKELHAIKGHGHGVTSLAVTPDGKKIISKGEDTIRVWDIEILELHVMNSQDQTITPSKINHDNKNLRSTISKIFKIENNVNKKTFSYRRDTNRTFQFMITPDNEKRFSLSNKGTIKIWDIESGKELRRLKGHNDFVNCIAVTPDSKKLISGFNDGTIKIWDIESGKELRRLKGHNYRVTSLTVTPDGKKLISGFNDGTIKIWDLDTNKMYSIKINHYAVTSLAVTPDNTKLISESYDNIKIWDIESGKEMHAIKGYNGLLCSLVVTPDGKKLISGFNDGTIKIWDIESGKEMHAIKGHNDFVNSLTVNSNSTILMSVSFKDIKLWNVENGKILARFIAEEIFDFCTFSSDQKIIAGDDMNKVHLLKIEE